MKTNSIVICLIVLILMPISCKKSDPEDTVIIHNKLKQNIDQTQFKITHDHTSSVSSSIRFLIYNNSEKPDIGKINILYHRNKFWADYAIEHSKDIKYKPFSVGSYTNKEIGKKCYKNDKYLTMYFLRNNYIVRINFQAAPTDHMKIKIDSLAALVDETIKNH